MKKIKTSVEDGGTRPQSVDPSAGFISHPVSPMDIVLSPSAPHSSSLPAISDSVAQKITEVTLKKSFEIQVEREDNQSATVINQPFIPDGVVLGPGEQYSECMF